MPEYSIQKTDFEKQKKELSEKHAISTKLDKVSVDWRWSDFWSGGHKVTGEEFNSLVIKLQSWFVEISERERENNKEFIQIRERLYAFYEEFKQDVITSAKTATEANKQAEEARKEAEEAQKQIDDIIERLQITINKLKKFKDEINQYEHIKDIDNLWCDIKAYGERLQKTENENMQLKGKINMAYTVAGGAIALSMVHFILQIAGIL